MLSFDVISLLCLHKGIGLLRYLDFSMPKFRNINLLESKFHQDVVKIECFCDVSWKTSKITRKKREWIFLSLQDKDPYNYGNWQLVVVFLKQAERNAVQQTGFLVLRRGLMFFFLFQYSIYKIIRDYP